jgi:hypothetical protein
MRLIKVDRKHFEKTEIRTYFLKTGKILNKRGRGTQREGILRSWEWHETKKTSTSDVVRCSRDGDLGRIIENKE